MQKLECEVIDGRKYLALILLYMALGAALSAFIVWRSHQLIFVWIGMFIFLVLPGILQKQFQKPFSESAVFEFSAESMHVRIFSNNLSEKEYQIDFNNIVAFRAIESYKDDSAFLKIYLKGGETIKYNLIGRGSQGKGGVIDSVFSFFKDYNLSRSANEQKIFLQPSLFSRPRGKILIFGLSILLVSCVAIQLAFLPKSIPASMFMGIVLFLIILQQRKKDVLLNKRMSE